MFSKKELMFCDTLFLLSVFLFLTAHFATNLILAKEVKHTAADYENVVKVIEANPVANWMFRINNFNHIFSIIIVPSGLYGWYWLIRRLYTKTDPEVLQFYTIVMFLFSLNNALNDSAILIGKFM